MTVFACAIGLMAASGVIQWCTPIFQGDEKMYHASRVIYWLQHETVFPYTTHNDRQNVFTFGSELFFLWPVVLTRVETAGRMIFWLGYPFAAVGEYLLFRSLGASRLLALVGMTALVSTPIFLTYSVGLKPEMWATCALIGTVFWAVQLGQRADFQRCCFFMGLFAILTINIRMTALIIVPFCLAVPLAVRALPSKRMACIAVAAGMLTGVTLSGIIIPLGFNFARYHHLLGPPALQHVVRSEISAAQMYTHFVRLPLLLFEFPDVPPPGVRSLITELGNRVSSGLGAVRTLPGERSPWPGLFSFSMPEYATKFSLGGVLWLPTLIVALVSLSGNLLRNYPMVTLSPESITTSFSVILLSSVWFGVRWMPASALPERFLIVPYAIGNATAVLVLSRYFGGSHTRRALPLVLTAWMVYPALRTEFLKMCSAIANPVTDNAIDAPFSEALSMIPVASKILFAGDQGAPDYPLFAPRQRYGNQVISWGKAPFEAEHLRSQISQEHITYVLIENDQMLDFHWDPPVSTKKMVDWLAREPDMREVPLKSSSIRLFAMSYASPLQTVPFFKNMLVPPELPLLTIDPTLAGKVGIVTNSISTPWSIENVAGHALLWIGEGEPEGLSFSLWSGSAVDLHLNFGVTAGPSRSGAERHVALVSDNLGEVERHTFVGDSLVSFPVRLKTGLNGFRFYSLDRSTQSLENDQRRIIVGVRNVGVKQ